MPWTRRWLSRLTFSSFLGCAIKAGVVKYGGWNTVRRAKSIMIGLTAGEMLEALVPATIGAICCFASGKLPPSYMILPSS